MNSGYDKELDRLIGMRPTRLEIFVRHTNILAVITLGVLIVWFFCVHLKNEAADRERQRGSDKSSPELKRAQEDAKEAWGVVHEMRSQAAAEGRPIDFSESGRNTRSRVIEIREL